MFLRRGTAYALLSTLVGFGAWYTYGPDGAQLNLLQPSPDAQASATQRKVLVLGQNDLQTGTFVGDGPITKVTADGRRVVEMINPDQATEMLRRGEESVYVQRGEGVVRYDVVQLPSNDPIEDDHAEQVMQVLGNNKELSDWMFWGVFDGHRYVCRVFGVVVQHLTAAQGMDHLGYTPPVAHLGRLLGPQRDIPQGRPRGPLRQRH
jgi:pyruvate dehydrogenase phosphatase